MLELFRDWGDVPVNRFDSKVLAEITFQLKERALKECPDADMFPMIFDGIAAEFASDLVQTWYSSRQGPL